MDEEGIGGAGGKKKDGGKEGVGFVGDEEGEEGLEGGAKEKPG